jgi:shikimate dehydrogenase
MIQRTISDNISATTELLAVIGHPIKHSLSPVMHNAALSSLGLDLAYVAFDVPPGNLRDCVKGMKAMGFRGFNVTIPHKQSIMDFIDYITTDAGDLGAVNTVVIRDGETVGYNTDSSGLLVALETKTGFRPGGNRAILLGAGGAAWACAMGLARNGLRELVVINRTVEKARVLCNKVNSLSPGCTANSIPLNAIGGPKQWEKEFCNADLFINATPMGMSVDGKLCAPIIHRDTAFPEHLVICDMVYRPYPGDLISNARSQGCPTVDGLDMLLYQGVLAFKLFTGQKAPIQVMENTLRKAVWGD